MGTFIAIMAVIIIALMVFIPGTVYLCVRAHGEASISNRIRWGKTYKRAGGNQYFLDQRL